MKYAHEAAEDVVMLDPAEMGLTQIRVCVKTEIQFTMRFAIRDM
jgi:hypothetical protein